MTEFARLKPGAPVPQLKVGTVGGPCWRLCDQKPKHFTVVLFYRGLHCVECCQQLQVLERKYEAFQRRGVSVLAVSSDCRARADQTAADFGIDRLTLCWGLGMDQARAWGLYISEGRGVAPGGIEEPAFFVEPALFLVRPDGTLYGGMVQTMPIGRPCLDGVLAAIDEAVRTGEAPRGGSSGHPAGIAAVQGENVPAAG